MSSKLKVGYEVGDYVITECLPSRLAKEEMVPWFKVICKTCGLEQEFPSNYLITNAYRRGCKHSRSDASLANMERIHKVAKSMPGGANSRERQAIRMLIYRTSTPANRNWISTGGKGIRVCDAWLGNEGFLNFLADMGKAPHPKARLKLKDGNKVYGPGTCYWE